ncbi:MAG: bacillithiol system redox-active protein YtxJ [Acidobacteria bacterium]|nr:bacillithiol system redox-active protein YtxJ [Acidobacteriota bacterium]
MSVATELNDLTELDNLWQASHERPVLFFKHSATCSISARAFQQFQQYLEDDASQQVQNALIVVQTARPVSHRLAELSGVQHESPQAILVRNGKVVWHDSHFELKRKTLAIAVENQR